MALLADQRNSGTINVIGFDRLAKNLDAITRGDYSSRLLSAAEAQIIRAVDAEMSRHPGELQQSMESTGPRRGSYGWYLAYRATDGNEKDGERKNTEKMVFLINREYIRQRNGHDLTHPYAIPADDVITKAVLASYERVLDAMQTEFDRIVAALWEDD